ncbi:MAG: hypothetical protein K8R46_13465 [Pirellulales bacterium]|nr:hypothetical protein [Pirellulales bacterium]
MTRQMRESESTAALVGLLLLLLSWELTAAMFLGRWLFGPGWFGPFREWMALGLSVALSIYHHFWGRKLLRHPHQIGRRLTFSQTIVTVILMITAGVIGTFLFCHGRG